MSNQLLRKTFDCLGCKKPILLEKIDAVPPGQKKHWNKLELDGETEHICNKKQQQQPIQQQDQQPQQQPPVFDTTTERAILELLQLINRKLDAVLANQGVKL